MNVHVVMSLAEDRGGAERLLSYLLSGAGTGTVQWSVTFLEDGPMVDAARRKGIDADVVTAGRMREAARYARTVRGLARRMKATNADAVLSWMPKAHYYAAPAAALAWLPAVWYQHGRANRGSRSDVLLQRLPARGVIATSASVAEFQAELRPRRRTRVVHPAVDPLLIERVAPSDVLRVRQELGVTAAGPVVGTVGRLQRWKGFQRLIEALPALRHDWPGIACVIVGGEHPSEPGHGAALLERAAELGVGDNVTLAGWQVDVAPWLAAMDVFVHLSDYEPFGMVILESMAAGTPVVASAAGGPSEIITHEIDGLLIDPTKPGEVSEAIARYLRAPAFRREVVAAARLRAQAFSVDRYREDLADAVLELVGSKPPARPRDGQPRAPARSSAPPPHAPGGE
jgi:glycosyltransferase involved in cell wall biosynthesis